MHKHAKVLHLGASHRRLNLGIRLLCHQIQRCLLSAQPRSHIGFDSLSRQPIVALIDY
jgi:hypothetical protein